MNKKNSKLIAPRRGIIAGSGNIDFAAAQGTVIFIGRKDAEAYAGYIIDHWNKICTFVENRRFATLSYSNSRVTIHNNLSVAISYSAFLPPSA